MAKKAMILKQQAKPKFSSRATTDARSAADPMGIFASSASAASASESLHTTDRSRVLRRQAGNISKGGITVCR